MKGFHTYKHADRDDTGDLIIDHMLCNSNGTDNKYSISYYVY